jgi:hypothetical protein
MIRFLLIALAVAAALYLVTTIVREVARSDVDWRGVAFACGFVALALYLSHATGIGGLG